MIIYIYIYTLYIYISIHIHYIYIYTYIHSLYIYCIIVTIYIYIYITVCHNTVKPAASSIFEGMGIFSVLEKSQLLLVILHKKRSYKLALTAHEL